MNYIMIKFVTDRNEKEQIAATILHQLPECFGLPDGHFLRNSRPMQKNMDMSTYK